MDTHSETRTLYDSVEEAIADVAEGRVYKRGTRKFVLINGDQVWYLAGQDGQRRWEPMTMLEDN